jgi:hypothetical protein
VRRHKRSDQGASPHRMVTRMATARDRSLAPVSPPLLS